MDQPSYNLAVFVDFENLALGFEASRSKKRFDISLVLARLVEKGKLLVKKAYGDWARYQDYKDSLHIAAFELIDLPKRSRTGKNSGDIRLCVDAMDLVGAKTHIDSFVIVSGDSDFSPLVSKLKENGKHVIGIGARASTSELLIENCDEFIYYEDLSREKENSTIPKTVSKEKQEALQLMLEAVRALQRDNRGMLYSSLVKDTMKRKKPQFDESSHGYRSFSDLLEHGKKLELILLREDQRSGTYVVSGFGKAEK